MKEQIKACQEALRENPNNHEAFQQLADILRENRRWKSLLSLYEAYPSQADWPNLVVTLTQVAQKEENAEKKSGILHVCGQVCEMKLQRLEDALKFYQIAVKTWPARTESFDAARRIYKMIGNYNMVIKLLQLELQCTESSARKAVLLMELSDLCREQLNSDEKASEFEVKAREIDDEAVEAYLAAAAEENAEADEVDEESAEVVEESAEADEVVEESAEANEVVEENTKVAKAHEVAEENLELPSNIDDCCEAIYRLADKRKHDEVEAVAAHACTLVKDMAESEQLCDALDEVGYFDVLAITLATLAENNDNDTSKRLLSADQADVLDLRLEKRNEALEIATPIAEGSDRAAYKAKAVLAGDDKDKLQELTASITDLLKKLRRTPEEVPMMSELAHIYSDRLGSMKDAEEQYKRIKMAEPKNSKMLRFYCKYYESTGDWQRVLSSLQTLKGAVAGSYRELNVSRQIADVSENKLNNPNKAVNVWNQMLKDGQFVDVAREELIGLYQRTQKWQALLEIYKNDLEAVAPDQKEERIAILKKSIAIYDEQLHMDAMVIKFYHQILEIDPNNAEAVDALIERYEASKRWNDLLKILTQKAESTTDKETQVQIYYSIANLWSNSLGNVAKSIDPLIKVIELDPTQRPALRSLHEFYEQRNNWASLYDIICKESAVAEGAEKISLLRRQAEIAENNLHSTEKTIASWEEMSSCLEDPSEALQELARLYQKEEDFNALLSVYERGLEHAHSETERIDNMDSIATIYLDYLEQRDKGLETLRQMLDFEEGRDQALEQLTTLHREAGEWDELVKLYLSLDQAAELYELLDLTAGDIDDEETQIGLYERMAQVAQENLQNDDMAIAALEKILEVDATHEKTARRLLNFYLERGEHAKAIQAIQIIIPCSSDLEEKVRLHVQLADLYENELNDADNAANWYAKAIRLAPERADLREHFESLIERNGNAELLYEVYSELCKLESLDEGTRVGVHRILARACQQKLNKTDDAIASWEVCLNACDSDLEAINALCALYEQAEQWENLLTVLDRKLNLTEDADEIRDLSFKRAALLVSRLGRLDEAEKSYYRILDIDENNLAALNGLKSLYNTTENWGALVEILKREQDLVSEGRLDVIYELAETERIHLNQMDEAISLYAAILDEDSTHAKTISTLEELINQNIESSRLAAILEPVYERAGEYAKQCEALEIRLRDLDDASKLPILWQIYELRFDTLSDVDAAFDASVRLFKITPDDERIWDNLNAIADAVDEESKWQTISDLYAEIEINDENAEDWRYELLRRRALIVEERLERENDSIGLWEQIHDHDPENLEAIQHLEKLYKSSSNFEKLVKLLEFETELSDFSDEDRVRLRLEAAHIYEDILENASDAIRVYRAVLDIDATNDTALSALERLYASCEMWQDLATLYEDEQSIYTAPEQLNLIRCKLADVCDNHLSDYERAIDCYRAVLDENKSDDVVAKANALLNKLVSVECDHIQDYRASLCELLEPIYVDGNKLPELIEVLRIKLRDCEDTYDCVELNRRIAYILRDELNDDKGAFEAFKAALRIDVSDESLRTDFETLALKLDAPKDIIDLYEESLKTLDDDTLSHALYKRVATVYEDILNNTENAILAYRAMLEIDDMDSETLNALENLYTNEQNWTELIDILHRKSELGSGDDKVEILRKMATINRDCICDTKAAIESYREILDNVSDDSEAISALEDLYAQVEDWESLCDNYGIKLQLASSDEEKRSILKKMAQIQEEKLKHYDEAISYYVQVLDIFPNDEDTLDALDRLYLSQESYDDLADILQKKLELHRDTELANAIEYRLGQVYQNNLDSVEQAIEYYRSILERCPDHVEAHEALRGLLENEDYRMDASRVLESLYEHTEQNEKLAEILEIQLANESDPYAQVELLKRIASIHQDKLTNYEAAFNDLARIVKLNQEQEFIDQIEGLCDILDNKAALVDVYKEVVVNVYDPELQVSFNNKIADALRDHLNDENDAESYYKATLEVQADNDHALDALDEIYTNRESWKELLEILNAKLDAAHEPDAQLPTLYRMAEIQESLCDAHDDAIATYQRILEITPSEQNAKDALSAIYEKQEMWSELSDLLRAEIGDAEDKLTVLPLRFKLAKVQNEKLKDDYEAIQTLHEILNDQPDHEEARAYLEKLFEEGNNTAAIADILEPIYRNHNDWDKLIHSLEVRVNGEEDEFSKAQILAEIATTWANNLHNSSKALETYGRILILQPTDTEIQNKVESLAAKNGELNVWAELYTRIIDENLIDDYHDKRVIMISLARLLAERLDNHDKARELCNQMLEEDAEDMDAYDLLEWSYAQKREYTAMLALWIKKAEIVQDQDAKLDLLYRTATLQEEIARDDVAACQSYKQMIEIDQNNANAAIALERLLRKTEQYQELADFYRAQSDYASTDDVRVEYLHKLGVVLARELHNVQEATEVLGNALSMNPSSTACKRAVESMLNASEATPENAEIRHTMATMLEPLYTDAEWNKLIKVLEVMIESTEDIHDKVALYIRVAELYEAHDSHRKRAFDTYAKAFVLAPSSIDAREKLEAIAPEVGDYALLADVYEQAVKACEDDSDKLAILEKLATIYLEKLNNDAKSAECYEAILASDEYHLSAMTALEKLYAKEQLHEKLVAVLRKHVEIASDPSEQKSLLNQIAELQKNTLHKVDEAISTYHAILEIDAEDANALDALEALYEQSENWDELINIYKRKIDSSSDAHQRAELGEKVARVYREKLNDSVSAIDNYVQALTEDADNIRIMDALEELYAEANCNDDLLDILQSKVDHAQKIDDAALKHDNQLKIASLLIHKLEDKPRAIEVLRNVLDEQADNENALALMNQLMENDDLVNDVANILLPIYKNAEKFNECIRVYERQIQVCSDDFDKRNLYVDAAKLASDALANVEKAFEFIACALAYNPSDDDIIDLAKSVADKHAAYDKLTALCEKIIANANDPDASLKLSLIAADAYENKLDSLDKTIEQFERILTIDENHEEALSNLHRLYRKAGNREKLADILQRRIDAGAQPLNEMRLELANLKIESAPTEAYDLLKEILWEDAENADAIAALEKLLGTRELVNDIAEFLEPVYNKHAQNDKLAILKRAKADVCSDLDESLTLLREVAKLQTEDLHDEKAALETYVCALHKVPLDGEIFAKIVDIANRLQLWSNLADAYDIVINASENDAKIALLLKKARILADNLQSYDEACTTLNDVLKLDDKNLEALNKLEQIYTIRADYENLIATKARLADLAENDADKKKCFYQCADIALNTLKDNNRGMTYLEKIIALDDAETSAIESLITLYRDGESFDKYVELLNTKLKNLSENDARFDVYLKIAVTCAEKLNDNTKAVEAYRAALDIRHDANIYSALEKIFIDDKRYDDLDNLYASQIEDASAAHDKANLRIKRANIAVENFHDDNKAVEHLNDALADEPANDVAFEKLDDIYTRTQNFKALCDLLKAHKEVLSSNDEIVALNIRIAKIAAIHLGDQDKAIESLNDVLARQPRNIEAIDSLFEIYENQKNWDNAFNTLRKKLDCLDSNEEKANLQCRIAKLSKSAGRSDDEVEAAYNEALKLNPRNDEALVSLLDMAKKSNRIDKQIAILNVKADIQDSDDDKHKILLEIADIASTDPAYAKDAAAALAKVYAAKSDDIDLGEKLVLAYIKAGDTEAASPVLEGIIASLTESKQTKRLPPFYSLKGRMLKVNGDIAGARKAFEEANAIDKNNVANNLELGILLYENGEYDAALKIMQTLLLHQMNIKEKDVKTNMFYYLGMLRVKTNDPKRAKDMFTRALGVDPNHAPTKEAMAAL